VKVILVELGHQGVRMGDPAEFRILPQVFASKDAAQRYLDKNRIRDERITFLEREVKT